MAAELGCGRVGSAACGGAESGAAGGVAGEVEAVAGEPACLQSFADRSISVGAIHPNTKFIDRFPTRA